MVIKLRLKMPLYKMSYMNKDIIEEREKCKGNLKSN